MPEIFDPTRLFNVTAKDLQALGGVDYGAKERLRENELMINQSKQAELAEYLRQNKENESARNYLVKNQRPSMIPGQQGQPGIGNSMMGAIPRAHDYGELRAQQMQANEFTSLFGNYLTMAQVNGDEDLKNKIAEKALSTGNPMLVDMGNMLKSAQFPGKDKLVMTGSQIKAINSPDILRSLGYQSQAQVDALNDWQEIEFTGKLGKQMHQSKITGRTVSVGQQDKEYWTSAGYEGGRGKPVTFNKQTGLYYDMQGEVLKPEEVEKIPPSERGTRSSGLMGNVWAGTGIPGVSRNRNNNQYVVREQKEDGTFYNREINVEQLAALSAGYKERQSAASQAGGAKTASLYRADKLFQSMAPKLIHWKEQLKEEDKERLLSLVSSSKSLNELTNGIESRFRDNPTQALLLKNTVLLADALSTVYGAGPGGQWSFEVAKGMLDPMPGIESFKATLDSHGTKIKESLASSKAFPKSVATPRQIIGDPKLKPKGKNQVLNPKIAEEYYAMTDKTKSKKERIQEATELAEKDGWVVK